MTTRQRIALSGYVLVLAALTVWGISFMLRSEFTPYHSVAVGMPWSEVPPPFQILILAFLKLAGGLWLTITLCIGVLIVGPYRRGERLALWAVPLLLVVEALAPWPAMILVMTNTQATPPWIATVAFVAVALLGMAITVTEKSRARGV